MSKKVLVAVDGSQIALDALDRAVGIVGTDASFVIVEVTDPVDRVTSLGAAAFDTELVRSSPRTPA